ncbi:pyruvate kinase [Rhodococcus sp. CH91]|uniref:pyruvate kinase n=1 Tax=Rhodococcus sp. CH91 TaxID=2910256 RepID=UPI001F4B30E3|nr:pyruvate kinase [Rhodococcus sp. CH91]
MTDLPAIARALDDLRARLVAAAAADDRWTRAHPAHRGSAENLAHYVALRHYDIRSLQNDLASWGLSSLGRAEAHVLASVDAVCRAVASLADLPENPPPPPPVGFDDGERLLERNAEALLGAAAGDRRTRIMVTLPSEAAEDGAVVAGVVAAGAELVRINCAHDGPDAWDRMIAHVRRAERACGRRVTVTMDLAGPKLRTGAVVPGPAVVKLKPIRDALGRTVRPVQARLVHPAADGGAPAPDAPPAIPVTDAAWLGRRHRGDRIVFADSRGAKRAFVVVDIGSAVTVELADTAYLVPGTPLRVGEDATEVGGLPTRSRAMTVRIGDELVLDRDTAPADPDAGTLRIGCTLPQVFEDTRVGHRIFFDDGRIGGVIEGAGPDALRVRITDADLKGSKLRAEKGINLPDTDLQLSALTDDDLRDLPFVVGHADAVSLSFVRSADDVALLQDRLAELGGEHLGVILKVETVSGFENLPAILFAAMQSPRVGVMIARGDLAVEAGYGRLAEVQEEILWVCEAAHVPVIWATQVLDRLARTGRPSRAEITDAAASGRAECVMLNKGPYVDLAVRFLDDVLHRMSEHQRKKGALLRRLRSWDEPPAAR